MDFRNALIDAAVCLFFFYLGFAWYHVSCQIIIFQSILLRYVISVSSNFDSFPSSYWAEFRLLRFWRPTKTVLDFMKIVGNWDARSYELWLEFFIAVGGMNRSHRLSQGAKKVTPPSIPSFSNPRGSGSSFGSDLSYNERCEDSVVSSHPMSTFSRAPNGESSSSSSPGKKTKMHS